MLATTAAAHFSHCAIRPSCHPAACHWAALQPTTAAACDHSAATNLAPLSLAFRVHVPFRRRCHRLPAAVDLERSQPQGLQLDEARGVRLVVQALVVLKARNDLVVQESGALAAHHHHIALVQLEAHGARAELLRLSTAACSASRSGVNHMPLYTSSASPAALVLQVQLAAVQGQRLHGPAGRQHKPVRRRPNRTALGTEQTGTRHTRARPAEAHSLVVTEAESQPSHKHHLPAQRRRP